MALKTKAGSSAVITLHGAQLVSWIPAMGGERLYLSEKAEFAPGKAIRGGVPVLFPQFGLRGPGPKHGFVRQRAWAVVSVREEADYACATLRCESDAETRALWPHDFVAELTVMIERNRLDLELEITNTNDHQIEFTAGLHTYLSTGNVEMARLVGLEGLNYLDALHDLKRVADAPEVLFVDQWLDRVYLNARKPLLLSEPARHMAIEQEGFPDVVVWNPWETGIASFADMAPGDFKRMLCIEAAAFERPVKLAAGDDWCGRQTLIALPPGGLVG
ncbi:MAG TPA: D-hexose-6-phosphate mutarotase [Rhodocyclaceae bacterium]|nr:D-hexose-6-phosphate mutarotase [Rhodocyclaceae bacterium]